MPCLIAYPNRFERALSVSGQGWVSTLPLANLQTRQIAEVARAMFTRASAYVQLPASTPAELIALIGHNLSTTGKLRARGYGTDPRPMIDRSTQVSTLDLDFETLPASLVTCTRSGTATYFDADLVLRTAAANTARFGYDPNTGKALGVLAEGSATNYLLWSRDLTNAAWTKTNMTVAKTATGADGVANSASVLTAGAANATVTQQRTTGASGWVSVLARRVSGSGGVQLTGDNFGTTTTMALTTSWKRFWVSTAASPATLGIKILVSGDVIEVDFAQMEAGFSYGVSSPIPTTTASATRNADSLSIAIASHLQPNGGSGSWVIHMRAYGRYGSGSQTILTVSGAGSSLTLRQDSSGYPAVGINGTDAVRSGVTITPDTDYLIAASYASASHDARFNGVEGAAPGSPTTTAGLLSTITIAPSYGGYAIRRLTFFPTTQTGTTLAEFSTPVTVPAPGYDSGLQDAWPAAWLAATTAEQREDVRFPAQLRTGTPQSYPFWRIDLVDPSNPEGFVQVGHAFMGTAWVPPRGMASGASPGFQPRATITESYSGAEFFDDDQPTPLLIDFSLPCLSKDDALLLGFEMQRQLGTTRALFFSWDPADPIASVSLSCLARLLDLGRPVARKRNQWALPVRLKELL